MPDRVQLSRAKGWRMPPNTVKVDRTTKWGNPLGIAKGTISGGGKPPQDVYFISGSVYPFERREDAQRASVDAFKHWILQWPQNKLLSASKFALRGKNLACWCKTGEPCHADVLLRLANDSL